MSDQALCGGDSDTELYQALVWRGSGMMPGMPAFMLAACFFQAASAHATMGVDTPGGLAHEYEVLADTVSLLQVASSDKRSKLNRRGSDIRSVVGDPPNLINMTISMMMSFPGNATVLQTGCQTLALAAFADANLQEVIVDAGAQELAISAMQSFPQQWELQAACSNMLAASVQWKEPLAKHGGDAGAVEVMIAAVKRFPEVPEVRKTLCNIGSFCDFVIENRQRVNRAGGVELALQLARDYYDAETETSAQCFFSTQCPMPEENVAAMDRGGYIPLSVQVMSDFPRAGARGEAVFIFNMCFTHTSTHLAAMVEAGVIEETIKVLKDGAAAGTFAALDPILSDTRVGVSGMSLLGLLAQQNVTVRNMAVDAGAIEAIASVVFALGDQNEHMPFGGELSVLDAACMSLTGLLGTDAATIARASRTGMFTVMSSWLSHNSRTGPARLACEPLMLAMNWQEH
mmetsp:Transcript_138462/g.386221  ORF Transcript_138462/g.386221 Transcript_138462/m.386221 type:complete len:459 (-) Transcript_138462:49-1425(-)